MSLLDSRYPELDLFLQRWRNRLNAQYRTGQILAAWAVAALPAALIAEGAGRSPWLRAGLWLLLTAAGTAGFVLWKRRRFTSVQAGLWLDQAGRTQGLFTAAAECLEHENPSFAAQRVLAEAQTRHSSVPPLRLPWKPLAWRAALALGSAVFCASILTLATPVGWGPLSAEPASVAKKSPREAELPANGSRELTSAEAAKRLFPEDARLAALAEQALASGDPGALEALLEQNADAVAAAQAKAGTGPKNAPGAPGASDPQNDPGQGSQPPEGNPPEGTPGKPSNGGSGTGSGSNPGSDKKGGEAKGKEGGQAPRGLGSSPGSNGGAGGPGESGKGQPGGGSTPFGSGGASGTEHSDLAFGPLARRGSSSKQVPLKDPGSSGVFEYILPGADSKLPLARVLADSQRSAEALFSRTLPPQEFENTIRDYFLSLSQEVSP